MKRNRLLTHWISRYLAATTMLVSGAWHASAQTSDPAIVSEPQDVSAAPGTTVRFVFSVSGTLPLITAWYRLTNSTAIKFYSSVVSNGPSGTYSFTNSQIAQTPQSYFAVSSNVFGVVTSRVATLNVGPSITDQPPANFQTYEGGTVTLSVRAAGSAPLSYLWYFNGNALAAATASTLSWTNSSTNASGSYQVVVSNNYGSATSRVAIVTIVPRQPVITSEPLDIQTNSGANIALRVAVTGYPLVYCQWSFNGSTLAGATLSSLTFTNVSTNASGSYQAIITNSYGSETSRVATLTIQAVPPTITSEPLGVQATTGSNVTLRVTAAGSPPLSYQWSFNSSALAAATKSSLSLSNVSTSASGAYQATVSNNFGSATSRVATLTVTPLGPQPPAITKQPANVIVSSNGPSTATFSVTATGDAPLIYQWYFNGSTLDTATASSLTLSNAAGDTSNAGSYNVLITNGVGSVTSRVATLTFRSSSPPQITLLSHSVTNGDILLLSSLETNKNYTLQSSSNMVYWANIYSFLARTTALRYTNHQSTNLIGLYYRISSP